MTHLWTSTPMSVNMTAMMIIVVSGLAVIYGIGLSLRGWLYHRGVSVHDDDWLDRQW